MRLDRFLCEMNMGSRSDVKALIRKGQVTVNGSIAASPEQKIDETADVVTCNGQPLKYKSFVYYMMNKPAGVVSATTDRSEKTVLDLLRPCLPECDRKREIVPAGRLDKDTEGLLLLTDDGALVHDLLSPKKHVDKTYLVRTAGKLSDEDIHLLETGVDISATAPEREKASLTLPAKVEIRDESHILLTIHEGRYHQVKRMLQAVGNEVLALKRVSFGALTLDPALSAGECRELMEAEVRSIKRME